MLGTPGYMAPEVALGDAVDGRADLYAVGCVAYYMLTGEPVFQGTPMQVMAQHLQATPVPPSQRVAVPIPPAMDRLVLDCLAKKPENRPASAAELERRLASIDVEPWTPPRHTGGGPRPGRQWTHPSPRPTVAPSRARCRVPRLRQPTPAAAPEHDDSRAQQRQHQGALHRPVASLTHGFPKDPRASAERDGGGMRTLMALQRGAVFESVAKAASDVADGLLPNHCLWRPDHFVARPFPGHALHERRVRPAGHLCKRSVGEKSVARDRHVLRSPEVVTPAAAGEHPRVPDPLVATGTRRVDACSRSGRRGRRSP